MNRMYSMEKGGNSIFDKPATNIDDAWAAMDAFPLVPGDERYIDCSKARGADTVGKIVRILKRHHQSGRDIHLLFTGYRGNGKTTELYQLKKRIDSDFEVIYFDAAGELDMKNLKLTDMLVAIARKGFEGLNKAGYVFPDDVLKSISDWFLDRILERADDTKTDNGNGVGNGNEFAIRAESILASIVSTMKSGTRDREILRRRLESNITELIERVNYLLATARKLVKAAGKKDLLFIMDSLDRITVEPSRDIFLANGNFLKDVKGNFIFVIPISLLYDDQATLLPFDEKLVLPMIPVYRKGVEHTRDEKNISHLIDLIQKRIDISEIFTHPKETLTELVLAGGGHLRDLIKLVTFACNETDDKITPRHAKTAINMLVKDYERMVRDDDYKHLVKTYRTQSPPNNIVNQKLIYNNVILVYEEADGADWKDVHPAVVKNSKFQRVFHE